MMAVCGAFLALSFYSVVAGWTIDYFIQSLGNGFSGISAEAASDSLDAMYADPLRMIISQLTFITLTVSVVAAGIRGGLERALKWMTPALFVILLMLLIYAMIAGDFAAAVRFMFVPDFALMDANTVLMAVGQAFFSLGIGLGVLMTVAAYMDQKISILKAACVVAFADGFVALLAGLAIFPIVFANNLSAAEGPGLIFATLPVAFGQIPGGEFVGPLFFLLMAFAALTSAITILETIVAWGEDYTRFSRRTFSLITAALLWVVGLATVFSFNIWQDLRPASWLPALSDKNIFGVLDYIVSNLMMPIGGVAVAILAGWSLSKESSRDELSIEDGLLFRVWRLLVRYLVPLAIVLLFLMNLGS
jgi:NSS family neurotransmitter:Na+ symporter